MAGHESGPIISQFPPYRLPRVTPLSRQPEDPLYQEICEQVEFKTPSSDVQDIPYD